MIAYYFPLMAEEIGSYLVIDKINVDDLLDSRPGGDIRVRSGSCVTPLHSFRQWWEPIEDEI